MIIPGYAPTFAANLENLVNMTKIHDMSQNLFDPICFSAAKSKSNSDNLTMGEMKKSDDRSHFEDAMQQEISSMFDNQVFCLCPKADVPRYKSILPAIWSFL